MPKGVKPPASFKGVKGKSGRKTRAEEVDRLRTKLRDEVTNEMLIKLSQRLVYKQLEKCETLEDIKSVFGTKEFAMPILLKGMVDKKEVVVDSVIQIVNYADTVQLPTKTVPTTNPKSDGRGVEKVSGSLAS